MLALKEKEFALQKERTRAQNRTMNIVLPPVPFTAETEEGNEESGGEREGGEGEGEGYGEGEREKEEGTQDPTNVQALEAHP